MGLKYFYLDGGLQKALMPWYGIVPSGQSPDAIREAKDAVALRRLSSNFRCRNKKCSGWNKDLAAIDLVTPTPKLPKAISIRSQWLVTSGAQALACVRQGFLDKLEVSDIKRWLWLGNVIDTDGKRCQDWLTFRFRPELIFRGSGTTDGKWPQECTVCSECGLVMYWPRVEPYYVLEKDLDGRPVYTSNCYHLILREDIFSRLDQACITNVKSGPVATRKEPIDGLPAILA